MHAQRPVATFPSPRTESGRHPDNDRGPEKRETLTASLRDARPRGAVGQWMIVIERAPAAALACVCGCKRELLTGQRVTPQRRTPMSPTHAGGTYTVSQTALWARRMRMRTCMHDSRVSVYVYVLCVRTQSSTSPSDRSRPEGAIGGMWNLSFELGEE